MIVVLDTNVWISALQFAKHRGTPTRALAKAMSEDVIASCAEIETEILRVLTQKFRWEANRVYAALEMVLARAIRVHLRGTVKQCRDPNDDMFLECAVRANADLLIQEIKIFWFSALTKGHASLLPLSTSEPTASLRRFHCESFQQRPNLGEAFPLPGDMPK